MRYRNPRKGTSMTKDEALKMALEYIETNAHERRHVRWAIKEALEQPDIIQVSPLEFVTRVTGKEEIIGEPAFWAQWPSKGKNT
jgi:hypothetical protein